MIKQYTKRPVIIDAIKFEYKGDCINKLKEWLGDEFVSYGKERSIYAKGWLQIGTLEDGQDSYQVKHVAKEGDYIIKGIKGEFYACKPEIFEETYEQVIYRVVEKDFDEDTYYGC